MDFFKNFVYQVAELPAFVSLFVCPALLVAAGVLFAIFRLKKAYLPAAIILGGIGYLFVYCKDAEFAPAWLALYVVLAALIWLLLRIPFKKKKKDGAEELYKKFRVPLEEPAFPEAEAKESGALYDAEECGLRLAHAASLLETLLRCELSASDRLEADAVSRTLDGYRGRALSADEMRALNDCLATVLKLTAKYKL